MDPKDIENQALIGLGNQFSVEQSELLFIPYGDHPITVNGVEWLQRFDVASANEMVSRFNSMRGALTRRFAGLPFYIGHPDHSSFTHIHKDQKAYGWIVGLLLAEGGMDLRMKWSEAGDHIIANAHYKFFSPHWKAREIGVEGGRRVAMPIWLVSAGFTNTPNWPVFPLANETSSENSLGAQQQEVVMLEWLRKQLGLANEATEQQVKDAVSAMNTVAGEKGELEKSLANVTTAKESAESTLQIATTAKVNAETQLANETKAKETAEKCFKDERGARIVLLVNEAIVAGKIESEKSDKWIEDLTKDFEGKSVELGNATKLMKTDSQTKKLGSRSNEGQETSGERIVALVNQELHDNKGMVYHDAYMKVKRLNADLFKENKEGK